MVLTTLDIYKQLPKTNCKDCGLPTCMALAMQVAAKQKALTDCPHISEETKSDLSDASTPPMKQVGIGSGDREFICGQETVMFRHEERFFHPTGLAVRLPASLPDNEVYKRIDQINRNLFERVGETLKVALCAVELDDCTNPVERVKNIARKSRVPLILMGKDKKVMAECSQAIQECKPLIYFTEKFAIDSFIEIAAAAKLPLAIGGENLKELSDLTRKAREKGVEEIVLSFENSKPLLTYWRLVSSRRSALLKNFKPLGFPAMVVLDQRDTDMETIYASIFANKYASIVLINDLDPSQLTSVLTSIQDIYTNPQVPNTVEEGLYKMGDPGKQSPVLFTTNFALTYFSVAGEVERSRIPSYICVVDTEGMGVLNAYAGDKISPEKVIKTLVNNKVTEKVDHRKLIIPGLLPVFKAELEDTSEWKEVIIGPKTAREIPAFLNRNWK